MTGETAIPAAGGVRLTVRFATVVRGVAVAMALAVSASFAAQPISWGDRAAAAKTDPGQLRAAQQSPASSLQVIVREAAPASSTAEDLVRSLGGTVTRELGIVGSFAARVPARSLDRLAGSSAVWKVWGDARLTTQGYGIGKYDDQGPNTVWKQDTKLGSAQNSYLGDGVGVALIDTGVVPTTGLKNRVVALVDFSGERDGMDRFGHGTHLAGLIAGDPTGATNAIYGGVAPHASLISVKVAGYDGSTDVSVVIAALQWVVAHKADYNIRVVNLSFGTDSRQPYSIDPLDYAVERAWFSGLFVVVSAGNVGPNAGAVTKPGDDPYVMTVGVAALMGTVTKGDDIVPDIVAPGISLLSDRDVNSVLDQQHPLAVVDTNYFKGTGTSQAAAIVSGTAALMFQSNPSLTPDVAKAVLMGTADKNIMLMPGTNMPATGSGAGFLQVDGAVGAAKLGTYALTPANRGLVPSTGLGSLEASRGSAHVYADLNGDGVPELVVGEIDVLGQTDSWYANGWGANGWGANGWGANAWGANGWGANAWGANGWGANAWGGMSWSANAWGANGWGANAWGANAWGANGWGANAWGANGWGANAWGANAWGANGWGANAWG